MADTNMNKNPNNETMQREQAKASAAGERKPEQGKSDEDRREQARLDKERLGKEGREKSAIGGGESKGEGSQSPMGQSGQGTQSPTGQTSQNREFDKSRSEPTSR